MVTFSQIAHIAIVVRDMTTSVNWYERVLGFERVGAIVPGPPQVGHPRQLMMHRGSGLTLAVHEPLVRSGDLFDPNRTGLDHISLAVDSPEALQNWRGRLEELKVDHQMHDIGRVQFIAIKDPDEIPWELWVVK